MLKLRNCGATLLMLIVDFSHAQTPMVIDWTVCQQPDSQGLSQEAGVKALIKKYVDAATVNSKVHVAVGLNRQYGIAVQERRDHVRLNYIPIGPKRTNRQCALSDANYAKLIQYRDASYYIMCRSEVSIGSSKAARVGNDLKALTFAAIYDFAKGQGVEMRAKADEPMTPPGGYAACTKGAEDGKSDPFPSANDVATFKTRLSLPDSEKSKLGDPTKQ